jgi:hypothetical protein
MEESPKTPVQMRNCEGCGEPMQALRSDKRFHSDKCRKHYNKYIKPYLSQSEDTDTTLKPSTQLRRNSEEIADTKALYLAHQRTLYLAKYEIEQQKKLVLAEAQTQAQYKLVQELLDMELLLDRITKQSNKKAEEARNQKALTRKKDFDMRKQQAIELVISRIVERIFGKK